MTSWRHRRVPPSYLDLTGSADFLVLGIVCMYYFAVQGDNYLGKRTGMVQKGFS